ncbi:MAG: hypothetical protein EBZ49_00275 [Proteobacteria bacterium]|nr:hypothetical protein [Pseudomonadota bacterium]
MQTYDFPVSLQNVYTRDGVEVPRVRAVVREDNNLPIAAVSNRYNLVLHKDVMNAAEGFVQKLGTPERKYMTSKNGAILIGEYTYANKTLAVRTGEVVGMRVYIKNAYNASMSVQFRVGALVLKCLNGMMSSKDMFSMTFRHTGTKGIEFPDPDSVIYGFQKSVESWKNLTDITWTPEVYREQLQRAINNNVIPKAVENVLSEGHSAWDLYNQMTYYVTHKSKASGIGAVRNLDRIADWFKSLVR